MPVSRPAGYSATQILLHWAVALLILGQFLFSDAMNAAQRAAGHGGQPEAGPMVWQHIFGGLLVLAFAFWRLMLRRQRGVPGAAGGETPLQHLVAQFVHGGLYLAMILLPLSGLAAWFGGNETAAAAHQLVKMGLILLLGLHVLGALYNQVVLKNRLIARMMRARD